MSDTVAVALISALGTVIVALLGVQNVRIGRIRRDAAETREQVANNHIDPKTGKPINLREESDERHLENGRKLDQIIETQADHGERLERLESSDATQDGRIEQIEHTWPRSRFQPPARHRQGEPQ